MIELQPLYDRMFLAETSPRDKIYGLFSVKTYPPKDKPMINRADWYSGQGLWLGCGDLNHTDLMNIKRHLPDGECFVIVDEAHEGKHAFNRPLSWRPDISYISHRCTYIITNEKRYITTHNARSGRSMHISSRADMIFSLVSRDFGRDILAASRSSLMPDLRVTA